MATLNDTPEGCAWSAEEWDHWIAERVGERATIFATDPDEMVSAYNREVTYTNDYHGRELLELLQNADDEGAGASRSQKVTIVLIPEGLCFANTGRPFSAAGVKSLMISDNSPKKYSRARYIGNRGLGFRSVLSWTDCPLILSGNLSICFDKTRVGDWLEKLAAKSERVRLKIEEISSHSQIVPVPMLAAPSVLSDSRRGRTFSPKSPSFSRVWAIARNLRSQGYHTVIGLPFTSVSAFEDAQAQLDNLGREVVLFLRNIKELIIRRDGAKRVWTANGYDTRVEISSTDKQDPKQTWDIRTRKGVIPDEFLKAEQKDTPEFEIRLAVPAKGNNVPGVLFSHFPTLIRFPFPLIAHASIELTNNRQYLVDSRANAYLLSELAEFMVEIAEHAAAEHNGDGGIVSDPNPWRPLSLVAPRGDIDLVAQKLGFRDALIAAAKRRDLIPVRDGRRLKPGEARRLPFPVAGWLPDTAFEDVTAATDDPALTRMVDALGPPLIGEGELRRRLDLASPGLSTPARANVISGLIKAGAMPQPPPSLLVDDKNEFIAAGTVIHVPPVDGATFDLPDWMPLRLLHGELVSELRECFGNITPQELITRLKGFSLRAYSLATLATAINARVNAITAAQPDKEAYYRLSGLRALFRLYSQTRENEIPKRPEELRVRIFNRPGGFAHADTLYFGADYPGAELTEYLYGPLFPEKIAAAPEALELDAQPDKIKSFLVWLGVASKPRLQKIGGFLVDGEFKKHVVDQITYPASFGEYTFDNADDLPDVNITNVSSLDGLKEIIDSADPHAIVAWLALDKRFESWRVNKDRDAMLSFRPYRAQLDRRLERQPLPSYVLWLLQHRPWLTTSDGSKRTPVTCTLAPNLPDEVKAVLPRPAINESDVRFKTLRVDRTAVRHALERVGVNATLDDLSWDDFYSLLLRLPETDPDGKHARAVYRALAARGGVDQSLTGPAREKFMREGRLWARRRDSTGYYPVADGVYYADDSTVPQVITRAMCLLELDRRKGAQKVHRLFGAKPLSYREIKVEVTSFDEHPLAGDLQTEVDRLKPYVYAVRLHSDQSAQGLRRLRELKVILCRGAAGSVTTGDDIQEFHLGEGDMILSGNDGYLCSIVEATGRLLADALIAHDVGEIFARLLGVENGGDFTSLAQCTPNLRPALLQRMLGVDPQQFLDEALRKLNAEAELDSVTEKFLPPPPASIPPPPPSGGQIAAPATTPNAGPALQPVVLGQVDVRKIAHTPLPPATQIKARVRATPSTGVLMISAYQVTDAKRCQELAFHFEEAGSQGRFPLKVDHLQGSEYFGCDLLSFASQEDRDKFRQTLNKDLVLRFIEVKGRSSEKGSITLKGNELAAALKYRERYYVYRIFEAANGKFEVAVLNDPILDSFTKAYEIDLFREPRTARYKVVNSND